MNVYILECKLINFVIGFVGDLFFMILGFFLFILECNIWFLGKLDVLYR